jgi:hypothetical protein
MGNIMRVVLVLFLLLFFNCQESTFPSGTESAKVKSSGLIIDNNSSSIVYYAMFERDMITTLNWAAIYREDNEINQSRSVKLQIPDSSYLLSNEDVICWVA